MFAGDYTTIGKRWDLHPRIIKGSLNAHLGASEEIARHNRRD